MRVSTETAPCQITEASKSALHKVWLGAFGGVRASSALGELKARAGIGFVHETWAGSTKDSRRREE